MSTAHIFIFLEDIVSKAFVPWRVEIANDAGGFHADRAALHYSVPWYCRKHIVAGFNLKVYTWLCFESKLVKVDDWTEQLS